MIMAVVSVLASHFEFFLCDGIVWHNTDKKGIEGIKRNGCISVVLDEKIRNDIC